MAGLSMGGMETHSITLKHLDTFAYIGLLSGGVVSPTDVTNTPDFKKKVKLVFCSCGSFENPDQHSIRTTKPSTRWASRTSRMFRRTRGTNSRPGAAVCMKWPRCCFNDK